MSSLNQVSLIGRLGADPEIRNLNSGQVCNFNLATSEKWTDKNTGEKHEKTEWHRIVVWHEGLIAVINDYVRKGTQLYIQGRLETRKWQDQNGNDKYTTEVILNKLGSTLVLLGSGQQGQQGQQSAPPQQTAQPAAAQPAQPAAAPAQPAPGDDPGADRWGDVPF